MQNDSELFNQLDEKLKRFVAAHSGMQQRDTSWYTAMGHTVGGSEVAALLGCNPYSNLHDVVASKVALLQGKDTWGNGGAACWWGILFEDIAAMYTEIELKSKVRGDEICVQRYPGHRNSPDGYIVAYSALLNKPTLEQEPAQEPMDASSELKYSLWTSDMPLTSATLPRIFLLEFKCPLSRCPTVAVPKQYIPQIWSGLAVSPIAHAGLFIDCVFRKCALSDLGPGPIHDTEYHVKKAKGPEYAAAAAWGLVGVYAPNLDAPRWVRFSWRRAEWAEGDSTDTDYAVTAWHMKSEAKKLNMCLTNPPDLSDLVDFGPCPARMFDQALGSITSRKFTCQRLLPCLADGRGLDLHTTDAQMAQIKILRDKAPRNYYLLGVIPWKLFEVSFTPVARRPFFMKEMAPLISEVHERVRVAMASPDPEAHLRTERRANMKPKNDISDADACSLMYS